MLPMIPAELCASINHVRTRFTYRAGIVGTLLAISMTGILAVDSADDEGFSTISRREHDPYRVNDLRFGYSMLPAGAKISVIDRSNSTNAANYSKDTNWDLTGRTGLTWMTPWSGLHEDGDFLVGLEVSTNHLVIERSNNSPEIDFRSYQLTLHPAAGWLIDDHLHLELNPYASWGISQYRQSAAGSGKDWFWEFGFRAAGYYTWRSGLQLGLQMSYHYGKTRGEIDPSYDVKFEMQGVMLGLQLGLRL